jgi:hypothetical protein
MSRRIEVRDRGAQIQEVRGTIWFVAYPQHLHALSSLHLS